MRVTVKDYRENQRMLLWAEDWLPTLAARCGTGILYYWPWRLKKFHTHDWKRMGSTIAPEGLELKSFAGKSHTGTYTALLVLRCRKCKIWCEGVFGGYVEPKSTIGAMYSRLGLRAERYGYNFFYNPEVSSILKRPRLRRIYNRRLED